MATERFITPARYIAGKTDRATLTVRFRDINGKRRSITVKEIGSYRLREDGSLFSVRSAEKAGSKNVLSIKHFGTTGATIKRAGGHDLIVSDVTLTLSEAGYPVIVA